MPPETAETDLRKHLRASARPLKQLMAPDVLELATGFWLSTSYEGVRPDDGDGLVAYFEMLGRRGTMYEFGVNRILRLQDPPDQPWRAHAPAWKLRLSIAFKPSLEVFQLKPAALAFSCWNRSEVASFRAQVEECAPFKLIATYVQDHSAINLSECSAPSGSSVHPTQGIQWAVA